MSTNETEAEIDPRLANLTGGSRKGRPNKTTTAVKAAILAAFDRAGGEDYLLRVANTDPKTFCALLGKVLPTALAGDPDNPIRTLKRVEVVFVRPEDRDPAGIRPFAATNALQSGVGRSREREIALLCERLDSESDS